MAISTVFQEGWSPEERSTPAAGRTHAVLTNVMEDGNGKSTDAIFEFEVLASSTPGQEGTVYREYVAKKSSMMWMFHRLAEALQLATVEQQKEWLKNNTPPSYEFSDAVGRHVLIDLQDDEYEGKVRVKSGGRFYRPTYPRCANWPKNYAALKNAGYDITSPSDAKTTPPSASVDDVLNGVV